jgi:hypothetical protein
MVVFNPLEYYKLARTAVETKALVTAKEPENHGLIHYSYVVAGETFYGIGHAGNGNPDFSGIRIGQELVTFYDSKEPSRSILGDPRSHLKVNLQVVIVGLLIFPLFVLYLLYRRLPSFRRWLQVT